MSNMINTPNFNEMQIGKLREYAKHMRVALSKTATKEEIIDALERKLNGRTTAMLAGAGDRVPPGHAKITVHEDPTPGSANIPVYINANGYVATIPRGVEIIVPMRVVRLLNDAKVNRRKQTYVTGNDGRETFRETTVVVSSYPYTVHDMNPGPEPLTAHELAKQKAQRPRKLYKDLFGHWPRPGELPRAIEKGLISLDDDDSLSKEDSIILDESSND